MPVPRDHRKSKGRVRETMTAGVRIQEIAAVLGVDPRTVEQYLTAVTEAGGRPDPERPERRRSKTRCGSFA